MARKTSEDKQETALEQNAITHITVSGYKSISREQSIEIRPLTILAGANSSGKSSMMQPLLLLKQTLEATYDPGPLLINGPNVRLTSTEQLFSRIKMGEHAGTFYVEFGIGLHASLALYFNRSKNKKLVIQEMVIGSIANKTKAPFHAGMTHKEIVSIFRSLLKGFEGADKIVSGLEDLALPLTVIRNRCFLTTAIKVGKDNLVATSSSFAQVFEPYIRQLIHVPGIRGNPERYFPVTAVGSMFPGTFHEYTASIIAQWQAERKRDKLTKLSSYLETLGLSWKVAAKSINDTQVELQVGRLPHASKNGARDLVNIADVGFGVSQTLPVLVALLVAEPGQLVYIEEPEIHLHPRAQSALAEIFADAAKRGVQVVIETHSQLLLLGIQTLVAEDKISPDLVKLHWFNRRKDGSTEISSADLNEAGAFGNWPEDFAEVSLEAESRYLDAAEAQQAIN